MLINVQFLRAIAAIFVVLYHTSAHFFALGSDESAGQLFFEAFGQFGFFGVDIFFVLSGYVMWHVAGRLEDASPFEFLYARLTRIYLGYWPYLLAAVCLVGMYQSARFDGLSILSSVMLFPVGDKLFLPVAWTLQYELYFYAVFFLLLFLPIRARLAFLLFAVVCVVGRQFYVETLHPLERLVLDKRLNFMLSPYCLEFLAGSLLACYLSERQVKSLRAVAFGAVFLFLSAMVYQYFYLPDGHTLSDFFYKKERVLFFGCLSVLMVVMAIESERRGVVFFPRFSRVFGGSSYSLYLAHTVILFSFYHLGLRDWVKTLDGLHSFAFAVLFVFILLYSALHYYVLERPIYDASQSIKRGLLNY